ncbi:MAG: NAD(P)-dependent oxidoreductase [Nitrospinota bacterium]|jgi:phosphoglycerate dehydrogenase-like enzyme|nr:NAD(P)-dependent oxidoreductase [Nitrospinota bacterium]
MTYRVVAVDPRWKDAGRQQFLTDHLAEGYELVVPKDFEMAAMRKELETASALVTGLGDITAETMEAAPNLRVVGKAGTGVDSIDVATATAMKIPVAHAPGWMRATPVAEHALTLMIMLSRKPWLWRGKKRPPLHIQMSGASAGIVGLGNIGQRIAARCAAFDMNVLAYTRTRGKFKPEGFSVEETGTLEELLARADYVILSLPLNGETRGLIGAKEFALMKPSAFLINVSRGGHVVTDDLVVALGEGNVAGAGLDVIEPDPTPDDHPIFSLDNVVISPHCAAQTESTQRESYALLAESIRLAVEGKRVESLVNPEIYD